MKSDIILTNSDELQRLIKDAVAHAVSTSTPKKPSIKKEVFTNKEAMKFLNVSRSTLQRWRQDGVIPFRKIQGSIMYTREDLEQLLSEGKYN